MSVGSAVLAGRRAAEARMLDTFEFRLYADDLEYNPDTQTEEQPYEVLFTTSGRVKVGGGLAARDSQAGGRTVVTVTRELQIPVDSPNVPAKVVAVCTVVDKTSDATLLGALLRLAGPAPGSQTTARRLQVTEVLT